MALTMVLSASAGDLKIDHVTVAGMHLEGMRKAFTAATGIPTEFGGPHANHITEMALASFPDGSYIELIGVQKGTDLATAATHTWGKFLRDNGGPCAFAVQVQDVNAEIQRLSGAGIHVGGAEKSGRIRPDGVALSWETADVGPGSRGSFFPFLIRDSTPRETRVFPTGKPTTARFRGVGLVVIGVHDLEASIAQYRRAFVLPEPKRQKDDSFGANLAWFEGTPVVLAAALTADSWMAHRVDHYGEAPCAFVLTAPAGGIGRNASKWFGRELSWDDEATLGWRLGVWSEPLNPAR